MNWSRVYHSARLCCIFSAVKRAEYLRNHHIFSSMGTNCMIMFRKVPLYPKLIAFGNNVWIASNVSFITHDVIHRMLNNFTGKNEFKENIGCIEINDNVFIGANSTILPGVSIGPDAIIGAGSLINKNIGGGYSQEILFGISVH